MIYIVDSVLKRRGGETGVSWRGREVSGIGCSGRYRGERSLRRLPWSSRAQGESVGEVSDLKALQISCDCSLELRLRAAGSGRGRARRYGAQEKTRLCP
jgi:hypothetical protein